VQFTDISIRALKPPAAGNTYVWDDSLKGFGLRISAKGTKTFCVLIGSGRRQTIGRYPALSLSEARGEAKRLLAEKTLGKVRPTHTAFADALRDYLAEAEQRLRPLTFKLYRRHLTIHYPFGRTSLADITPRDILRRLNQLTDRPSEKEHAARIGRTFFKWCVHQHLLDRSPMETLAPVQNGESRERVLTEEELARVYRTALEGSSLFHRLVALLILTGQRRGEISRLEWAWINGETVTLPAHVTKNKKEHRFPLGSQAKAVIEAIPRVSPYLFPAAREQVRGKPVTTMAGFSKPKIAFDQECGVTGWVLHDLRRTFATGMQQLGIRLEVTEALLNHVSGSRSGIVGIYQRYGWQREMAEAITLWEAHLQKLTAA